MPAKNTAKSTAKVPARKRIEDVYEAAIAALSTPSDDALSRADGEGYPDREEVEAWTERIKAVVLHQRDRGQLRAELPAVAERLQRLLLRVGVPEGFDPEAVVARFVELLPEVRRRIGEDVEAAFEGDPAAKSFAEIVVSYPSIDAIAVHRLAHELMKLGVPQIPRIMSEHAHARTGIDIHPGAQIGRRLFIDHGTGVVIGETSVIGDNVRIYQGVTLGAFSPRRGQRIRGTKRHPTIENDVTIYAGATILGGDTVIGHCSVISGNAVVTESVPPNSRVVSEPARLEIRRGDTECSPEQMAWDI